MWKLPFAVLLLFSAGCPAFMGNDVLFKCSGLFKDDPSIEQLVEGNWCAGYIGGLNDMAVLQAGLTKVAFYCSPKKEGLETGQVIRVFLLWLESHPAVPHESARSLFLMAMRDSFPCE